MYLIKNIYLDNFGRKYNNIFYVNILLLFLILLFDFYFSEINIINNHIYL